MAMPERMAIYAPIGQTPILQHTAAHREKVNMVSAVVHHHDGHVELSYKTDPQLPFNNVRIASFIRDLHKAARARGSDRLVVIWDNGNNHRGEPIRQLCRDYAKDQSLWLQNLPPYSPDFNPDEAVWRQLKHLPEMLANYAAKTVAHLHDKVRSCLARIAADAPRLKNMLKTKAINWLDVLSPKPPHSPESNTPKQCPRAGQ